MDTVGSRIRQERERLGLTQFALALMVNPTVKSGMRVSKWERDLVVPNARDLAVLMEAGFNIRFVLGGKGLDILVEKV